MLYTRCAHRLSSQAPLRSSLRLLSTTTPTRNQNSPRSPSDPPPATSTSAAQPFSTPFTPSPARSPDFPPKPASGAALTSPPVPKSSVKAGTLLRGLGYIKGKDAPVAREDHEYPEWLWDLLDKKEKLSGAGEGADVGDEFAKSKKQRRIAAKLARRAAAENPESLLPTVPLEQQSIDLPAGSTKEAEEARDELRTAMRRARRKGIKEANFLKGMK